MSYIEIDGATVVKACEATLEIANAIYEKRVEQAIEDRLKQKTFFGNPKFKSKEDALNDYLFNADLNGYVYHRITDQYIKKVESLKTMAEIAIANGVLVSLDENAIKLIGVKLKSLNSQ